MQSQVSIRCSQIFIFQIISSQLVAAFLLPCFFMKHMLPVHHFYRNKSLSLLSVITLSMHRNLHHSISFDL